ncbi:hypothetical protein HYV43_02750 [Candidatus Micrarchaeota archaeon]|nr:hypothetical protein [Candidatus Micrarchaeota archaeon]
MNGAFDWITTEFDKLKLFRLPSGDLRNAQFALLTEHHEQMKQHENGFPLLLEVRKSIRDTWISREPKTGAILVHALALPRTPDVERHADELETSMQALRERLAKAGIRARIHVSTYLNGAEPDNHLEQYMGEKHYGPFAEHVKEKGFTLYGLHSIVMRLEAPEGASVKPDQLEQALKNWRKQATLDHLRSSVRNRVIGLNTPKPLTYTARIAKRDEKDRQREASKRRARKEGSGQLKFGFMRREPLHRVVA